MSTDNKGRWRYQPVIVTEADNSITYLICEVHCNADGTLCSWTKQSVQGLYAVGDTLGELTADLCRMLVDAYSWVPIPFKDLRVGATFERAITMKQREALAQFAERFVRRFQPPENSDYSMGGQFLDRLNP